MPPATPPRRAPRFLRRPKARPDELIDAAVTVFGARGFRATTLEEVARHAGVSKGTIYLYFRSKDALFRAMVEQRLVTILEGAENMVREHTGTATELLEKVVPRMWDVMSTPHMVCLTRLIQAEVTHFPEVRKFFHEEVIRRNRKLLRGIVQRGVASGEFRADAVRMVPFMVPALVIQLNQVRFLFGPLEPELPSPSVMRDLLLDFVFDGIRAPMPQRRRAKPIRGKRSR